jgi:hypothetical protein
LHQTHTVTGRSLGPARSSKGAKPAFFWGFATDEASVLLGRASQREERENIR